jgi:hypothetical protein
MPAARAARACLVCALASLALTLVACAPITPAPGAGVLPACQSTAFGAFDFWLGAWAIEQKLPAGDGEWRTLPARNQVTKSRDGCSVIEHWHGQVQFPWEGMTSPEHIWGFSVRAYDPKQGIWRIYWMDQRRPYFETPFVGSVLDRRGEFYREPSDSSHQRRMRLIMHAVGGDHVHWQLSAEGQPGTWTPIWIMEMTRPSAKAKRESM